MHLCQDGNLFLSLFRRRDSLARTIESVRNVLYAQLPDNVDGAISLLRRIDHANAIRTAPVNALVLPPSYRGRRYGKVNSRECAWDDVL